MRNSSDPKEAANLPRRINLYSEKVYDRHYRYKLWRLLRTERWDANCSGAKGYLDYMLNQIALNYDGEEVYIINDDGYAEELIKTPDLTEFFHVEDGKDPKTWRDLFKDTDLDTGNIHRLRLEAFRALDFYAKLNHPKIAETFTTKGEHKVTGEVLSMFLGRPLHRFDEVARKNSLENICGVFEYMGNHQTKTDIHDHFLVIRPEGDYNFCYMYELYMNLNQPLEAGTTENQFHISFGYCIPAGGAFSFIMRRHTRRVRKKGFLFTPDYLLRESLTKGRTKADLFLHGYTSDLREAKNFATVGDEGELATTLGGDFHMIHSGPQISSQLKRFRNRAMIETRILPLIDKFIKDGIYYEK